MFGWLDGEYATIVIRQLLSFITHRADDSAECLANYTNDTSLSTNVRVGVYGGLVGVVWILCVARTVLFYIILLRATTILHNKMFISVLRSPILFFDTNPVGRLVIQWNPFTVDTIGTA